MLCAPITATTELDDQTIRFAASIPVVANPLDPDLEETIAAYSSGGGPLREMGGRAAGRVDELRVDDGQLMAIGRVIDPASVAKVKHNVLRGVTIGRRFVSLVDRLDTNADVSLFKSTFLHELRKAFDMNDSAPNFANPNRVAGGPDAPDARSAPRREFDELHDGRFRDIRAVFDGGPHFHSLYDLRDHVPPPGDLWRSMITRDNNPYLPEMLAPARGVDTFLQSNSAPPGGAVQFIRKSAAPDPSVIYGQSGVYDMLKSNSA